MQCNVKEIVVDKTQPIGRYFTAIERRFLKHQRAKRVRSITSAQLIAAASNDHHESECTVQRKRMPWHAADCDCVICENY